MPVGAYKLYVTILLQYSTRVIRYTLLQILKVCTKAYWAYFHREKIYIFCELTRNFRELTRETVTNKRKTFRVYIFFIYQYHFP